MKRDQRKDPKAGDRLRKDGKDRLVIGLRKRSDFWFDVYYATDRRGRCADFTWRKWAKDAEVLHVAE